MITYSFLIWLLLGAGSWELGIGNRELGSLDSGSLDLGSLDLGYLVVGSLDLGFWRGGHAIIILL